MVRWLLLLKAFSSAEKDQILGTYFNEKGAWKECKVKKKKDAKGKEETSRT